MIKGIQDLVNTLLSSVSPEKWARGAGANLEQVPLNLNQTVTLIPGHYQMNGGQIIELSIANPYEQLGVLKVYRWVIRASQFTLSAPLQVRVDSLPTGSGLVWRPLMVGNAAAGVPLVMQDDATAGEIIDAPWPGPVAVWEGTLVGAIYVWAPVFSAPTQLPNVIQVPPAKRYQITQLAQL